MAVNLTGIGITGLQAAQLGLATTGHNIANVSTPGFSRQQVVQTTQTPTFSGAGFFGQGTAVETVRRLYNDFLTRQVTSGEAESASLETFTAQMRQINDLLADPGAGLAPALSEFFSAVHDLANSPSTMTARQALLGGAEGLVSRFALLDQRLAQLRTGINERLAGTVAEVNALAAKLARVNDQIALAEGNPLQQANDLRDQRDDMVLQLNRLVGANVVEQGSAFNIFIGNGLPIVVGGNAFGLAVVPSATDPTRSVVGVATPGSTVQIQEGTLQGGALGGLLAFRSNGLEPAQNALGRIAIVLAGTFNDQHALGQDLNGALGGAFFAVPQPILGASTGNTGTAVLAASFTSYAALTTSDYLIGYDGTNYTVTRLSDSSQQTFGALPATVDGVRLSIASGSAAAGDQFLLRPVAGGGSGIAVSLGDPALIAAAAPIRTGAAAANSGSASISAGSVNAPPPPNASLANPVTITFTAANSFTVAGAVPAVVGAVAYTSGGNIAYNGWTVQISGTPAAGDQFTVSANLNGTSDGRNALLLAGLQAKGSVGSGQATYNGAYGQMVSEVGTTARRAEIGAKAQQAFLLQVQQQQQSFAGVNLDEEAANLVRYQQAYQGAARVIQISSRLFDDLLGIL